MSRSFMETTTVQTDAGGRVVRIFAPNSMASTCWRRMQRGGRKVIVVEVVVGNPTKVGVLLVRPWQLVRLLCGRHGKIDTFEVRP